MCGIAGWIRPDGAWSRDDLQTMTETAAHRGPDGAGLWCWEAGPAPTAVCLGHRRLAILDLSPAGQQPMASADLQHWLTFNGEIYNYLELRQELRGLGYAFRTGTDTEVLLAAYAQWGTDAFARCNGMWGLALVDLRRRVLVLSRDRVGIKPLYVWSPPGAVAFASELKQLLTLPGCPAVAHLPTLRRYIDTGYEGPRTTFFQDLWAFPPGCVATVPLDAPGVPAPQAFWHPERLATVPVDPHEAVLETRRLFADAVRLCLRADVPVGVCLSGGLDSSAVLSQVQQIKHAGSSRAPTYAFSAVFDDPAADERPWITRMLTCTAATGAQTSPTPEAFLLDADTWLYHLDEPPGSLSQYAAWAVMRMIRAHEVPVILNGQGGDELFSGYWHAYYLVLRHLGRRSPWQVLGHLGGALLPGGNPALLTQIVPHLRQYWFRRRQQGQALLQDGFLLAEAGEALWARQAQQLTPPQYRLAELRHVHLPRLLKWDDRNSMAFGIEGRYPFLDHRLVEWALTLPPTLNLRRGWTKHVLRQAVGPLLPDEVQWRRDKMGFETPQARWMTTVLAPALATFARKPSAALKALVDPARLQALATLVLQAPLSPQDERPKLLMRLFFLERWLARFQVDLGGA